MNTLMKGNSPLGMIYNQSAENIAYDSNNSVKDKIDTKANLSDLINVDNYNLVQISNGYRVVLGNTISGVLQLEFVTISGQNRLYTVLKDKDGNILFNSYVIMA